MTASDGTLSDVQAVTVNVADVAEITYDNVTLDFDAVGDVNSDWAFGGASASQTTYDSVGVLSFTHPVGAESWAGATIAKGYGETDFIADRGSVTARVWSDTTGTVRLAMEDTSSIPPNAGATRFIADTQSVTGGQWNDLTFNFPAGNAVGSEADTNYNQLVINTDEGNTVYVDQIVMAGADVTDPMTEGPTAPTVSMWCPYTVIPTRRRLVTSGRTGRWAVTTRLWIWLETQSSSTKTCRWLVLSRLRSWMRQFHLTVWRTDATADLKVKLVDFGADGLYSTGIVEHEYVFAAGSVDAVAADGWQTLAIPMSAMSGLTTSANIAQVVLSSHVHGQLDANGFPIGSGETLYVDDMYFSTQGYVAPNVAPEFAAPTVTRMRIGVHAAGDGQ